MGGDGGEGTAGWLPSRDITMIGGPALNLIAQKLKFESSPGHDNKVCDGPTDAKKTDLQAKNVWCGIMLSGPERFLGLPFLHAAVLTQEWLVLTRFPD